jgi:hypothetical protein
MSARASDLARPLEAESRGLDRRGATISVGEVATLCHRQKSRSDRLSGVPLTPAARQRACAVAARVVSLF